MTSWYLFIRGRGNVNGYGLSKDEKNRLCLSIQTLEGLRVTGKFSAFGILFQIKSAAIKSFYL